MWMNATAPIFTIKDHHHLLLLLSLVLQSMSVFIFSFYVALQNLAQAPFSALEGLWRRRRRREKGGKEHS